MRRKIALAAFLTVAVSGSAHAGPIYDTTVGTCATANCSSIVMGATLLSLGTGSAGQWVQEVYAGAGQCVRLDVTSEFTDLAMDVVSPDGTIYDNDQGGGACTNCPIIKIASAPKTGWYTVTVSQFQGSAAEGNFVFAYGRYPAGNANCSSPTPPLLTSKAKSSSAVRGADVAPANAPAVR